MIGSIFHFNLGGWALPVQFEGPEKKLEVILSQPLAGLRTNADGRWDRIAGASGSEIISSAATEVLDSYLLSESSLFIWDDRILMITCGQTNLVNAIPEILGVVHRDRVALLFYERKNLMYPDSQPSDFEAETARIGEHFPGKSYRLGPANHDHVHIFYSSHASMHADEDATLELLMHDLHPDAMLMYTPEGGQTASDIVRLTGIDCLYPDMTIDAHLFAPYGYSLNAISGAGYFTIHVTPQSSGSYASFETNLVQGDYLEVVNRVLHIFQPGRFSFVLTRSVTDQGVAVDAPISDDIKGFRPTEKSLYEFDCGYEVRFSNFVCK
jgi:S-adenosylmethionine decarboxylase